VRSFDPDAEPVTAAYAHLSPDGEDHRPIVLRRLQQMWAVEPSLTDQQLQCIATPTLIIVGDSDIVTREHAIEMFRAIPDAQLRVVPRAGHGIMPKEAVLTFLEEGETGQN
jgi:pimeloyl-ACP methyl ester carboxylesterase